MGCSATSHDGSRDVLEAGLLHRRRDVRRVHVGRADDLLALELVADRAARVDAHDQGTDAERDHEGAGEDAADLENFTTCHLLLPPV